MKREILLYSLFLFYATGVLSQTCEISVKALQGKYTGDCKNDKADGKGTATGIDSYTGDFKKGYPDGEGKYIWKDGSWYDGHWKNGLFEGEGTLSKINNPQSALVSGFWKKGKYVGQYEKPYIVHSITNYINDVNVRKINSLESEIRFTVQNLTAGASDLKTLANPKARLIDIQVIYGRFEQKTDDENSSPITNRYVLKKVTFPFYAIFSFETKTLTSTLQVEKVGIEIFENCNWHIRVKIDN